MKTCAFLLALLALAAARPAAAQPAFELPVDCEMGTVCLVQNYFDDDPGPDARDYECGTLAYDGHDGTDFRVPNLTYVERGVAVVAAAAGAVLATRDGAADGVMRAAGGAAVRGAECGNGVLLDHGGGWQTQYCHMRQGSVRVRSGQRVAAGETLGLIGMSGLAEFPHLHITVRHDGKAVDPFVGPDPPGACGGARQPLWSAATLAKLAYTATGPLNAGFTTQPPQGDEILAGAHQNERLPRDAPVLLYWAEVFGIQAGDRPRVRIVAPGGAVLVDSQAQVAKSQASHFAYAGARRSGATWAPGTYRGEYTLERGGKTVLTIERTVEVR